MALKSLTIGKKKSGGRSRGRVTVRHRGGGHKRKYRIIDFNQNKLGIPAKVESTEYDPNRSAFIAQILYADGERRYILAPKNLKTGQSILSDKKAPIAVGNRMQLKHIPEGTFIYAIELTPGRGAQLVRSAGTFAQLQAKEGKYAQLKLPSKEIRLINVNCMASIGELSNPEHNLRTIGKAGRNRWLGRRPTVRGSAMNPIAHPHGGGEGRSPVGLKHPKTPWGKPAYGVKTRKKKQSDKLIIKRRKK